MRINAWEWRWPLNTYRERDASKLSRAMLTRLAKAEAMSLDDYRNDLAQRDKTRALYAELGPRDFLRGRRVSFDGASGIAVGIDRSGRLVVDSDGERHALESGEVVYDR